MAAASRCSRGVGFAAGVATLLAAALLVCAASSFFDAAEKAPALRGSARALGEAVSHGGDTDLIQLAFFVMCIGVSIIAYTRSRGTAHEISDGLTPGSAELVNEERWGGTLMIKQMFEMQELLGIEAKQRYIAEDGDFYISERSDCCQRFVARGGRELTLFGHAGPSSESPVVLRMYKPYHIQDCMCCRPSMEISIPDGNGGPDTIPIGRVDDPFTCCAKNQNVFDQNDDLRFKVSGSVCQCGNLCICCADVNFQISDANDQEIASIVKPKVSCGQFCQKTNNFAVTFPQGCTMADKRLLVGAMMLLDLQYFEVKQ